MGEQVEDATLAKNIVISATLRRRRRERQTKDLFFLLVFHSFCKDSLAYGD